MLTTMQIRTTKREFGSTRKNKADGLNDSKVAHRSIDHHDEEFLQREKGIVVYQMCLLGFSL